MPRMNSLPSSTHRPSFVNARSVGVVAALAASAFGAAMILPSLGAAQPTPGGDPPRDVIKSPTVAVNPGRAMSLR